MNKINYEIFKIQPYFLKFEILIIYNICSVHLRINTLVLREISISIGASAYMIGNVCYYLFV